MKRSKAADGDKQTFGAVVSLKRRARELNQSELARQLGISAAYLSDIENDRRSPSSEDLLEAFARELGVNASAMAIRAGQLPAKIRDLSDRLTEDQLVAGVNAFIEAASEPAAESAFEPAAEPTPKD